MLSRLIVFSLLLSSSLACQARIELKGFIKLNEEGGGAVAGVKVSVAGEANITTTKESGVFNFIFPKKQPGDVIDLVVTKPGYVVVNWVQLKVTVPINADREKVILLICKEAEREEWARRFYRLKSLDAIEETYKRRIKELQAKNQQTADALAHLRQERDQAEGQAEKTAMEFARVKPGEVTNLYAQAMSLFLKGKVQAALQVLDDNRLQKLVLEAQHKRKEAQEEQQKAEEQESKAIDGYVLKAQLLTSQLRLQDAEKVYEAAVKAAPDVFKLHLAFANFESELNHFQSARDEYDRALKLAGSNEQKATLAMALNDLAILDVKQNRLEEARQHYEEALKIDRQLADQLPESYRSQLASTLVNLGVLDQEENRAAEGLLHYQEALTIYRDLITLGNDNFRSPMAGALNNLGYLEEHQNRTQDAHQHYAEALKIYQQLAEKSPDEAENVAIARTNLGNLEWGQGHFDEVRPHYEEAVKIYRNLAEQNPERYKPELAEVTNNLALLDADQKRPEEARRHYEEALKIYRQLTEQNSAAFCRRCMANTLNNFGILEKDQKQFDEARRHFVEALEILHKLAKAEPEPYLFSIAGITTNLGILDEDQGHFEQAGQHLEEALNIYHQLAEHNPEAYLPHEASTLTSLGRLNEFQNRPEEARQWYQKALPIYRQLAEHTPNAYLPHVARVLSYLGGLDVVKNRLEEGRGRYQEALNIVRQMEKENTSTDRSNEVRLLKMLGSLDWKESKWGQALLDYSQAIQLDPGDTEALRRRGEMYFYQSQFNEAEKDFKASIDNRPADIYAGLWLYLSQAHQAKDAATVLRTNSTQFKLTDWPGQVVQLYLGTLRREDVLRAAENTDTQKSTEQHCEAYFYLGEYALLKGDQLEATDLFQKSIDTHLEDFYEFAGATAELMRLKQPARQ